MTYQDDFTFSALQVRDEWDGGKLYLTFDDGMS
jgi:peptidoglycan/xylan/chitin deacetylase (PgdA/CDA1 family)